jgi:D-serine deaminase-like pyridoxal phosphate-dependent protein
VNEPRTLDEIFTPAAIVDVDRMAANLDKLAGYTAQHGLALWPHIKTHKTPELAQEQLRRGAAGLTVATLHEAEVMASVTSDILIAYPPVGHPKLERLAALAERARITLALDSHEALEGVQAVLHGTALRVGVLVELDAGMHRVGVGAPDEAVALATAVSNGRNVDYEGVLFYPGHIREPVAQQRYMIATTRALLNEFVSALIAARLAPRRVSGGSTPTAYVSHQFHVVNEIRPGTYIFNDRTTSSVGACEWSECAYSVLATVVSTSVPNQAVVDAGSKALFREELRGAEDIGFGALLDQPEVTVKAMSEEHGLLDLSHTSWRPRIGDRVRIVPNHVCVSVNLHDRLWLERGGEIVGSYRIAARGWT